MPRPRKHWFAVIVIAFGAAIGGCVVPGSDGNANDNTGGAGKSLVANLSGTAGDSARVEFSDDELRTEVSLAITGGQPGATVQVSINGVVVLSLVLDDFGNARVALDSDPDELGEIRLPDGFPDADPGDAVVVGNLSGTFEDSDDDNDNANDNDDDGDDDDDDGEAELELGADLVSPDSSLRAIVRFEAEGTELELKVHVRGGAPGSSMDVIVSGQPVGTIVLDSYGSADVEFESGEDDGLPLPPGFVAPVAGDTVSVGPLTGQFSLSDDGDDDDGDDDDDNGNDNDDDNGNDNSDDDNVNDNSDDSGNDNSDDD